MWSKLSLDLAAQSNHGPLLARLKIALLNHSFHLVFLIRFGETIGRIPFLGRLLRHIVEYIIRILYASDISCAAQISGGLNIMHGHDIVIGSGVVIGPNCKIFNGVTMGNKDTESAEICQPTLQSGVVVGTGAKLLGAIIIGEGAKIGANSVVTKNVPAGQTWVGVPARVLSTRAEQ
jgi:serine O-acetyltransferase